MSAGMGKELRRAIVIAVSFFAVALVLFAGLIVDGIVQHSLKYVIVGGAALCAFTVLSVSLVREARAEWRLSHEWDRKS